MMYWLRLGFLAVVWFYARIPVRAQELVSNGNFETYLSCPSGNASMPFSQNYNFFPTVQHWSNPMLLSSPDYFNACVGSISGLGIPGSVHGHKWPRSGNAYCGIIVWENEGGTGIPAYDYREYLQTRLTQPMEAGSQYCVEFYVAPSISPYFSYNYFSTDDIGVHFSGARPVDVQSYTLSLSYHIRNMAGVFFEDTAVWYKVSGIYTAAGGEEWLTLGSFKSAVPSAGQPLYPVLPDASLPFRAYVFIEDVSVRKIQPADTVRRMQDTVVCLTSGFQIPFSGVDGASRYEWSDQSLSKTAVVSDTGLYWCRSFMECTLTIDTFYVRYKPFLPLDLGEDTLNCQGMPVELESNYAYDAYQWNTGAVTSAVTVHRSGTYVLRVADICGVQEDTIAVTIQPPTAPPLARDTTICQFTMVPKLEVSGENIRWYDHPGNPYGSRIQPYIYTNVTGHHTLYVTQTKEGCESQKVPVEVTVSYTPEAEIGDYLLLCEGMDTLIGKAYPEEVFYIWNTGEQTCCIRPANAGNYILTILNDCGVSSDTLQIDIHPCDDCMRFPTAFTPNADGRNDLFKPVVYCPVSQFQLTVYNRWGEQVFVSHDVNSGWDGTFRGMKMDLGVYVYVATYYSQKTNARKQLNGNITLIR